MKPFRKVDVSRSAQNHFCHRTLNLVTGQARRSSANGISAKCRRQGRHQQSGSDGRVILRITLSYTFQTFYLLQVVVMADKQHTVTGSDTEQRNETDDSRNTDFACCDQQGKYTADQCQRQVHQDNCPIPSRCGTHYTAAGRSLRWTDE